MSLSLQLLPQSLSQPCYEFGPFRLEAGERRLLRDGQSVPLAPKAFDLLLVLVDRHGRLVEKEELLKLVWPDTFVEEANLSYNISLIRKALGEGENGLKYIETVPKRGYRFVAELQSPEPVSPPEAEQTAAPITAPSEPATRIAEPEPVPLPAPEASRRARLFHRPQSLVLLLAVLLLAGMGVWGYFRTAGSTPIESLAVLPFVNEGGNSEVEYLSDGMAETLISSLSQLPSLNVRPRSSAFRYKGKSLSPETIGKELHVQALLHGTLAQRGQDVALHIELIDAATERVLWSADYQQPLANLVALQSELGREVSSQLKIKLTGTDAQKLAKRETENAAAYQLYLRGHYHWLRWPAPGYEKARDYFQQAIEADPNYALAYAGLAEYYSFGAGVGLLPPAENWPKAEAAARKALALDDTLPETYNALAGIKHHYLRDLPGAERDLRRALELNPNYVEGRDHLAFFLMQIGRREEALAEMKKALALDPLSVRRNKDMGWRYYDARDYDRAIKQFQATLELDANDAHTHELLGDAFEQKGNQQGAITEWSKALTLMGDNELASLLERTYASSGFDAVVRSLWQKRLARLNERAKQGLYVPAMEYALAYARMGDDARALEWIAKAEPERDVLPYVASYSPAFDRLRSSLRFQQFVRQLGLRP